MRVDFMDHLRSRVFALNEISDKMSIHWIMQFVHVFGNMMGHISRLIFVCDYVRHHRADFEWFETVLM
jgi:hypothetical protein